MNETTETLKKLAINNSTNETEAANAKTEEQQVNGNEPSSSCNGKKDAVKESSTTS